MVLDADRSLSYDDGSIVIVTGVAPALDSSTRATDGLPGVGGPPLLRAALFDAVTERDPAFRLNALRALVVHAPDHPADDPAIGDERVQ